MDTTWLHLGSRLGARELRALCDSGREPADLARLSGADLNALGLDALAAETLREALRGARRAPRDAGAWRILTPRDSEYPAGLWRLPRPPAALWLDGALPPARRRVALVGSRRCTHGGRAFTRDLAEQLAAQGVEVWSGLARGIDGSAHEGALRAGRTVAVLGNGFGHTYPPEHRGLAARVAAQGALLSEFWPDEGPRPHHFPQRNRILASAVDALLVVEAGEKSGALISVNWALASAVPVMVAPGDPRNGAARGSNFMLRAGAPPLLEAADVLQVLGLQDGMSRGGERNGADADPDHPLLLALRDSALHVDQLSELWDGPLPLLAELTRLELEGRVEALEGGFYSKMG